MKARAPAGAAMQPRRLFREVQRQRKPLFFIVSIRSWIAVSPTLRPAQIERSLARVHRPALRNFGTCWKCAVRARRNPCAKFEKPCRSKRMRRTRRHYDAAKVAFPENFTGRFLACRHSRVTTPGPEGA